MAGQMCWMGEGSKILHLRESVTAPWRPYTAFAQHRKPDLQIQGASKGYTTMQFLLKAGWSYASPSTGTSTIVSPVADDAGELGSNGLENQSCLNCDTCA